MYKGAVEGCQLPWITRDFHTLLLHTPLSMPAGSQLHEPAGFFWRERQTFGRAASRRTIPQRGQVEHLPGSPAASRRTRHEKKGRTMTRPAAASSAQDSVKGAASRRGLRSVRKSAPPPAAFFRRVAPPERVIPSPRPWPPRATFPQESCLSCCRPCPPPRSASPDRQRDRPRGECGPSGT